MSALDTARRLLLGRKLDPFDSSTRSHVALIAVFAWIGLGADGLSSACYGPEEAYRALGEHTHLAFWLALATGITVLVISLSYNQVIDLFPSGGGGYKAATKLIGPKAGLISGSALIVDYVLTISISVASGGDALFSLVPVQYLHWKLPTEMLVLVILLWMNLRGLKESIRWLAPIFLGFVATHVGLIGFGILSHHEGLQRLVPAAMEETERVSAQSGWLFVAALFLRAYSMGAGTYTGIEAVSNNVNTLAEPRVRTGHYTMFYMAASLAVMASGTLMLYMLFDARPVEGQTLNAVAFRTILDDLIGAGNTADWVLALVLALEAGLLLVAANTGFLGGPAVLASMASDGWVPRQFRQLSSRMVTQNGVLVMGVSALLVLLATRGKVSLLVVLYSINVFLTFSLTLYGLSRHWLEQRRFMRRWRRKFLLSATGFLVAASMLAVILFEKISHGGWFTILVTSTVAAICLVIRRHYDNFRRCVAKIDDAYVVRQDWPDDVEAPELDASGPTAVVLLGQSRGAGMRTLKWVTEMFPGRYRNFLFVSVGEVDRDSFDSERTLRLLRSRVENSLLYFTGYCHSRGMAAESFAAYGSDPLQELLALLEAVHERYPQSVVFGSKMTFGKENFFTPMLHNQLPFAVQRQLEELGREMIVVPVTIPEEKQAPQRRHSIR